MPSDAGAVTFYYVEEGSEDYSAAAPSDAGSYKVYAVVADTSDYNGFTTSVETFRINKRPIKITANSAVFSYDGTAHSDSGYEIEGTFVVGQGFKEVKVTGSVTDVTPPGAGVVNKITYSGFAGDEDESVLSGILSFSCEYDPDVVGKREVRAAGYAITPAGLSSGNYSISFSDGTLTVDRAEIIITAEDFSVTYGKDTMPTFTFTHSDPLAYGESYDGVVSGSVTYSCEAQTTFDGTRDVVSSKPVDYAITPVVTALSADNYRFTPADGKLTVNKYTVTINGITLAPKVYDGTTDLLSSQVVLTGAVFTGMPKLDEDYFGANVSAAKISVTGAYRDKNAASGKTVDIVITAGSYLSDRCIIDLTSSQKTATADITARPLVITAEDKTVAHGSAAPEFTAKFEGDGTAASGFAENESADSGDVTFVCAYYAPDGSGLYTEAGSIDITPTALSATATLNPDNYDITFNKSVLTVSAAQLSAPPSLRGAKLPPAK